MEYRAASEPVRFAHSEATQLSAALRAAATELESQAVNRRGWAKDALRDWRGRYADQFKTDTETGAKNAEEFARVMRDSARQLDDLAQKARDEQDRRDRTAAWQAEQDSEYFWERGWESFWGTDEKPPDTSLPPEPPAIAPQAPRVDRRV